jgi:hypothetical protein
MVWLKVSMFRQDQYQNPFKSNSSLFFPVYRSRSVADEDDALYV